MVIPRVLHQKSSFPSQHLVRMARDGGVILPQKVYLCDNIALRLVRKSRAEQSRIQKLPLLLVHYCFGDSALFVFRVKVQHSAIASLLGFDATPRGLAYMNTLHLHVNIHLCCEQVLPNHILMPEMYRSSEHHNLAYFQVPQQL